MTAEEFWKQFTEYKDNLMDIDSLDSSDADALLVRLDKDLKQYSEGIDFVLGDLTDKGRTLTFTSEGDVDYFDDLISLCEQAPILDFWDIIAFKPAKGSNVSVSFEKYRISSKNLWFMPLESDEERTKVGLRVALKEYVEELKEKGIEIDGHILNIHGKKDENFCDLTNDFKGVYKKPFPVINDSLGEEMKKEILSKTMDSISKILRIFAAKFLI